VKTPVEPNEERGADSTDSESRASSLVGKTDPAVARSVLHRIAVAGGCLAVREVLNPEDFEIRRPVLVLLHGFTGSSQAWAEVASLLTGAFRVLCPDLPGHGESEFDDLSSACTMDFTVAALAEALTKLSIDDYSLAGYSLGGRVALHCALEDSTRISRLVLEGTSPGIADDQERRSRKHTDDELARFIENSSIEEFVDRWEQVPVLTSQRGLPEKVRASLRARRLACSKPGLAASLRGMGTGTQSWLGGRLGQIHVPTLLIAGAEDEKFKEIAKFMDARIPDSARVIVDTTGHSVHLEAPKAYAEAILSFAAKARASNGTEQ